MRAIRLPLVSFNERLLAVLEHQHYPTIPTNLGTHHVTACFLYGAQRTCEDQSL